MSYLNSNNNNNNNNNRNLIITPIRRKLNDSGPLEIEEEEEVVLL